MSAEYRLVLAAEAEKADTQAVWDGLEGYNLQFAAPAGQQPLYVFARRADGGLAGGLLGGTYWGWLYVEILWLEQAARGAGLGSQILAMAEAEALRRGCRHAHLDTLTFQALGFYQKHGYRVWGQLDDLPPGFTRYFLRKDLA